MVYNNINRRKLVIGMAALPALATQLSWAHEHEAPVNYKLVPIKDGFYHVQGEGGNVLLSVGAEGSLLIDSGFERNGKALHALLLAENYAPKYLINTHWHGDHTGGNRYLSDTATIIAHDNVRTRLSSDQEVKLFNSKMPAQPENALPAETFSSDKSLTFNGLAINLQHYADSHTDSDATVHVPSANIIHMGDLYFARMFPFIDPDSKGNIGNIIISLKAIASQIDNDTTIVPGHGDIASKKDLEATIAMLEISADTVQGFVDKGLSLEAMQAKGLPKDLVAQWGNGFINEATWINIVNSTLVNS